ncbi:MAG TPA: ABC transporter substrate-binding protein [Opitutaceae bacterium]|jgi:NitT/TauT family transport system substrate-binding protein
MSAGETPSTPAAEPMKIKVGYIGLTCEAPIFVAVEKGFFKEEGLDVSLVKCDWTTYKDSLALGGFDITHHLIMMFLKPIEQGMDVKFLAGVHRGCLRVQASASGSIHTVEDLRGKRIGVQGMGTPPFIFANRALALHGIDPSREVTWMVYPAGELKLALDRGDVDAVADSEPIGTLISSSGNIRNISDQATDEPFASEYCCAVVANGKFIANRPKAAAAATRAILRAAKWVEANPRAAAKLAVEKKYLASTPELNAMALSHLRYVPSVMGARSAIRSAAAAMQKVGMLNASTDIDELTQRAFTRLDGVSDEWLKTVQVEKVADGQLLPNENALVRMEAAHIRPGSVRSCCDMPVASN